MDVNCCRAGAGSCCLWEPGDSVLPAARPDLERCHHFLLLHLREDELLRRETSVEELHMVPDYRVTAFH